MSHPLIPIVIARYAWRVCPQCGAEVIVRTSKQVGLYRIRYLKCRSCGWGKKNTVPVQCDSPNSPQNRAEAHYNDSESKEKANAVPEQ
jgi:predicted RNA-binding Zn-ribbon protein involved in translation (DUF1610 family)